MAYINDPGGGRTGPYWRRQMGTTLPGERTGAQLQMINLARQRLGLPPLGGPGPGRQVNPAGVAPGRPAMPAGGEPTFGQGMNEFDPNAGVDPMAGEPGAAPPGLAEGAGAGIVPPPGDGNDETDLAQLRNQILNRYHGATQPSYSRDALRNYVQQHMRQRQAVGANQPRRPILPQRRAQRALPY